MEDSDEPHSKVEAQVCCEESQGGAGERRTTFECGEFSSRKVQFAEDGRADSKEGGSGTSGPICGRLEDDDLCSEREERAGRADQDLEDGADADPAQPTSDHPDGRFLWSDGNRPGLSGVQGVPRFRDVDLLGEEVGQSGGAAALRSASAEPAARGGSISSSRELSEEGQEGRVANEDAGKLPDSHWETWVRLSGPGDTCKKVEEMQKSGLVLFEELYVEDGPQAFFPVTPEELLSDDVCVLKVASSPRVDLEELVEEVEETALPKKTKTALRKAEKEWASEQACFQADVSEKYSQPRLTKLAPSLNLRPGRAYDIKCGFDLRQESEIKRMWRALEEDDPEAILTCPPCTPFSLLQEWNFPRMAVEKVAAMLCEGLHHVRLAAQICRWQHSRGKIFLFEHPLTSKAWDEPELQELIAMPGVYVCTTHMCAYGMRIGGAPNRKPTKWITNSYEVARELQRRCNQQHVHAQLLGGRAQEAEVYPPELCKAILRGIRRHLEEPKTEVGGEKVQEIFVGEDEVDIEELLDREVQDAGMEVRGSGETTGETNEESDEEPQGVMERPRRPETPQIGVTAEDRQKIRRLHVNLGHPSKESFLRFLSAGRVRRAVLDWVRRDFQCTTCESQAVPKAPRPAVVPKSYAPGMAVAVDLFFIPDVLHQRTLPVLNILDLGTNYQMVEIIQSKDPTHIWHSFWNVWGRTFGMPQYLAMDDVREFRGAFTRFCAAAGIVTFRIAARAPWQQGRVARHGGLMKELIEKCRNELPPTSMTELVLILRECECAKNRFSNRSGFSPMQRMTGQWPRMPGSLMSDEELDPALQAENHTDDFSRLMEARRVPQQAFIKHTSQTAVGKALHARPRKQLSFRTGDLVYVFRALRRPKSVRGQIQPGGAQVAPRAKWVGPGSVLAVEGSVIWINMMGELWRAAAEQVRLATMDEAMGAEIVNEHFDEMKERLKRSSERAGFRDVSGGPIPPLEEEVEVEMEEDQLGEALDPVVQEGAERGRPRPRVGEAEEPAPDEDEDFESAAREAAQSGPPSTSSTSSSSSSEFDDGARGGAETTTEGGERANVSRRASTVLEPEGEAPVEEVMEDMVESVARNERLDGVTGYDASRMRQVLNAQWRKRNSAPYFNEIEVFFAGEEVEEETARKEAEFQAKRDYWIFDSQKNVLQRHHVHRRKALFSPMQAEECPVPLRALKKERRTQMIQDDGSLEEVNDEWSLFTKKESRHAWWRGITEFSVDEHYLFQQDKVKVSKQKRGEGEVFPHEIAPSEWPEWEVEDKSEFEKIVKSGALKVLSVEESNKVREELRRQGKLDRILPSRMVRRYKPGDAPGKPRTRKSRFCIRGDRDPDAIHLSRFAPTVTTSNLQIVIQVARNLGFRGKVGDLKSAFTQSMPLCRQEGPLYCKSCHGSMPGLQEGQLCQIILGCYGLMDAPLNWRKTLVQFVTEELKYKQSVLDPCAFMLYEGSRLRGMLAIEVDDLLMFGDEEHERRMRLLQQRFTFGKIEEIDERGVNFNGRRLRQVGEDVLIDMKAFIEEGLHPVKLDAKRAKQKESRLTEEEVSSVRSTCGALNWAGRKGRPDAAAAASLFSSMVTEMKVSDVLELNKAVDQLKRTSDMALRIQPLAHMCWGVVSDASYANARGGKTQAGHLLITFEQGLLEGKRVKTNVLHWKGGKLKRVVSSTLAAETQSLGRGIGDLLWMMVMYYELLHEEFELRAWREYVKRQSYTAFSKHEKTEDLGDALALVDAKSLYDLLINETIGGSDRRNALDVQALRAELKELSGKIRWVDHPHMPADCLTKQLGKSEALRGILETGMFGITEEAITLAERSDVRKTGGYNRR